MEMLNFFRSFRIWNKEEKKFEGKFLPMPYYEDESYFTPDEAKEILLSDNYSFLQWTGKDDWSKKPIPIFEYDILKVKRKYDEIKVIVFWDDDNLCWNTMTEDAVRYCRLCVLIKDPVEVIGNKLEENNYV